MDIIKIRDDAERLHDDLRDCRKEYAEASSRVDALNYEASQLSRIVDLEGDNANELDRLNLASKLQELNAAIALEQELSSRLTELESLRTAIISSTETYIIEERKGQSSLRQIANSSPYGATSAEVLANQVDDHISKGFEALKLLDAESSLECLDGFTPPSVLDNATALDHIVIDGKEINSFDDGMNNVVLAFHAEVFEAMFSSHEQKILSRTKDTTSYWPETNEFYPILEQWTKALDGHPNRDELTRVITADFQAMIELYEQQRAISGGYRILPSDYYFIPEEERPTLTQIDSARAIASSDELYRKVDFLSSTNEQFKHLADGSVVYDTPEQAIERLDWYQGLAFDRYRGTCGLCSVVNIARLAGKNLSESDLIRLAILCNCCTYDSNDADSSGGTSDDMRNRLLSEIGIDSHTDFDTSADNIARLIESGHGVIATLDAYKLWGLEAQYDMPGFHAVTITSVERDSSGLITHFYLCDSGGNVPCQRIPVNDLIDCFYDDFFDGVWAKSSLNVTNGPIR